MNTGELLNLFCSKDQLREWMTEPVEQDGFVYATDANKYIRFLAADIFPIKYSEKENVADFKAVRNKAVYFETPRKISTKTFLSLFDGIPTEFGRKDCPTCKGDGGEDCLHCGQFVECETCKGRGDVIDKMSSEEPENSDHLIDVDGVLFNPSVIFCLSYVIKYTGDEDFEFVAGTKNSIHLFKFGSIEVAVMPIASENTYNKQLIKLTTI